jgi:hypothetical protein
LVPARGAGLSADGALVTLALRVASLPVFAGVAAPSTSITGATASIAWAPASAAVAPVSAGVAPSEASSSVSTPMAWRPARVIRSAGGSSPRGAP